jgi:CheY-like chemotaxis protein
MPLPRAVASLDLGSCVIAPLRGEKAPIGMLLAARDEAHAFSSGECEFLRQLAEHVALAVRQAQLHDSLWHAYEELRQTQQAVLQQERLSALGQMASGIAHDISNAISPAMLYVEGLIESGKELEGHRIATAGDGAAGIMAFRSACDTDAPYDVVITDLGMPRMDGRAVARAIREISPATPVILLTGWGQRPDAATEVLPHIDRVLGKPPKLQELRKALSQCLGPE